MYLKSSQMIRSDRKYWSASLNQYKVTYKYKQEHQKQNQKTSKSLQTKFNYSNSSTL
jgi:hypothetical protein